MYHPSCPFCRSGKVIKYGGKRWLCKHCKRTFRLRKKDRRDRTALNAYVLDRTTHARLGKRWGVHRSTAYRRVQRALERRMPLLRRTKVSLASCDGICFLDGKTIRVNGVLHTAFVAWDRGLGKPIHFLLREGGEKELWYWKLLLDLKQIGYVPKAFVSDGILTLKEFLAETYPDLPHQRCAVHVFLSGRAKACTGGRLTERQKLFVGLVKKIIWSQTLKVAKRRTKRLYDLHGLVARERRALEFVWQALPLIFVCKDPRWQHLHLPRSSNAIENVIGQIEARLKTRRGTKSTQALDRLINELLLNVEKQTITNR